ncbi:unnamed protein product [Moneuplotes crassus]|uniref:Uncharacterized protein n=1 Tax=Euplotes crassus TaxID=5936 RepID=A0AAD1X3S5_EUPCR|nr:unnamed protein product [Moneuplotes crassus]
MELESYTEESKDSTLKAGTSSLLFSFSHCVNVLKYFGYIKQCQSMLLSLCRSTSEFWVENKEALLNALEFKSDRTTLKALEPSIDNYIKYFKSVSDPTVFYINDYIIELHGQNSIFKFCEFIRSFENRHLIKFKQILVYYDGKMTSDVLNSPYDVLKEYSLDTSCIQVEGINMLCLGREGLNVKYTQKLKLSIITQFSKFDYLDDPEFDPIKEIEQFCFNDSEFRSLDNLDYYAEIIPRSIKQSCRDINIKRFPSEEPMNEDTIRNISEGLTIIFPNFEKLTFDPCICLDTSHNPRNFLDFIEDGISLKSFSSDGSQLTMMNCNVFYKSKSVGEYQSFSTSRIEVGHFKNIPFSPKHLGKGFIAIPDCSILEINNIHSKNTQDLSKFHLFIRKLKNPKKSLKCKRLPPDNVYIESKEFGLIANEAALLSCRPTKCTVLRLYYSKASESKALFVALEKLEWDRFELSVSNLRVTYLLLTKLMAFKVTDLSLSVGQLDKGLEKIPLKAKNTLKSLILGCKSLQTLTVGSSSGFQQVKRTDKNFEMVLDRILGGKPDLEFKARFRLHEVVNYY